MKRKTLNISWGLQINRSMFGCKRDQKCHCCHIHIKIFIKKVIIIKTIAIFHYLNQLSKYKPTIMDE